MATPYHVRLALSQYGDHFRAELFTEDLGDTEGDLVGADWSVLEQHWSDFLIGGGDLSSDNARLVGRELFAKLIGSTENAAKWQQVLERARREARPVRLLIDSTADAVRSLPFGLLCDALDNHYVFRPNKSGPPVRFVRIIRRCTPRPIQLASKPLRLLLAVAEPTGLTYDAAAQAADLLRTLPDGFEAWLCDANGPSKVGELGDRSELSRFEPFVKTTRRALRAALEQDQFDILHLIAHGRGGDKILLCKSDGQPDDVAADELGEWCKGRLQLAFLQACRASYTTEQGGFGGVAQQLLNPTNGDLAAVIAAPYPILAPIATRAAVDFYQALAQGKDLDDAIKRDGPPLDFIWAFLELWVRPRALGQTGTRGAFQFVSPYRGLSRFEERDADIFFGRESETTELLKLLREDRMVAVIGDSGSGKSSLLRAGVAARVRKNGLRDTGTYQIVSLTPGHHPAESLLALLGLDEEARVVSSSSSVFDAIARSCSPKKPLLLLFDQFEEMLTLCEDARERETVAAALGQAAEAMAGHFRVVLAMRSDYVGRIASLPGIGRALSRPWLLKPPTAEQYRRIMEQPALSYHYRFEGPLDDGLPDHAKPLLERLLLDPLLVAGGNASVSSDRSTPLPLIEFALERLWLQAVARGSDLFTHGDYDRLGGASGAVALHAEEIYQELSARSDLGDASQLMMERVMTALVSATKTSRPRRRTDLETESGNAEDAQRMIEHLVGERLLSLRASRVHRGEPEVELAHEVLIARWDRFAKWLEQNAETRAFVQEFQEDAEQWEVGAPSLAMPRRPENLPGIERAKRYLDGIERLHISLTAAQQAFAQELAALRTRDVEEKAQLRVALEKAGSRAIQICVRNGTQAIKERYLWGAWVWFAEALRLEVLRNGAETSHRVRLANVQKQLPKLRQLWFHESPAEHVAFNACGTRVLTYHPGRTGENTLIGLWDAQSYELVAEISIGRLRGNQLAFSPDGNWVMATICDADKRSYFRSWFSATGEADVIWRPDDAAEVIAFDPTGQWLLTCDAQVQLQVWEIASRKSVCGPWQAEAQSSEYEKDVALDVERRRVLQASGRTAWIWDLVDSIAVRKREFERMISQTKYLYGSGCLIVATYEEVVLIDPDQSDLRNVALKLEGSLESLDGSPDGKRVLTTAKVKNENRESRVWLTKTGNQEGKPILHEEAVERWEFVPDIDRAAGGGFAAVAVMGARHVPRFARAAAFTPDGRGIVTVSERKKMARLWDLKTREPLTPPFRHFNKTPEVFGFSADGCQFATTADDGTTRVWDVASLESDLPPIRHPNYIRTIAFAGESNLVAICSSGNTSSLWDLAQGRSRLNFGVDSVEAAAFSQDDRLLAVGTWGQTARVWDLATGDPVTPLLQHGSKLNHLAFSSDSRVLLALAGKYDDFGEVTIWDVASATPLNQRLQFTDRKLMWAELSPDARRVLVRTDNGVLLFDIATSLPLFEPRRHGDSAVHAQFSPDGREIWTYSAADFRRWDSATGAALARPIPVRSYLRNFKACSPDGSRVVMQSDDFEQLQIVDVATGEPCTPQMDHPGYVNLAVYSRDGRRLATSCENEVFLWDAVSGELLGPSLRCQVYVNRIAWSEDSARLAVVSTATGFPQYASDTNTIFVYDLQEDKAAPEALTLYGQASSQHRVDQAGGYVPLAIKQYREVYEQLHSGYAELLRTSGRDLAWHQRRILENGDYGTRFHLDQVVRKRPDDPQPLVRRAAYLREKRLFAEALADYNRALELTPGNSQLHRERGLTLLDMEEWRKAVDDLASAGGSSEPRLARQSALQEVATRLAHQGNYTEALEHYTEAVALAPATRDVLWSRGRTYYEMGDWQSAIIDLFAGLDENDPRDGYFAAIVACQANDAPRYRQVCQRLIFGLDHFLQDKGTVERWNNVYYVAWSCILADGAIERLDVLISILRPYSDEETKPSDSVKLTARLFLGAISYRSGDYTKTIEYLEELEIHPYDWLFLAMAHSRLADKVESMRYFDEAHDLLDQTVRSEKKEAPRQGHRLQSIICELLEAEAQQLLGRGVP